MMNLLFSSSKKLYSQAKYFLAFVFSLVFMIATPAYAAPLGQIDVSDLVASIGVIVAAVTSIGLGILSVVLLTKAFRYIRSAM